MQTMTTPVVKDLVLVGGGHAHVGVLRRLAMRPVPGLRVTLIARDIHTPYSGMLPGLIAGHYDFDQTHIDLRPLCRFAGARLYHNQVSGLDPERQLVMSDGRPAVRYDLLSINIGSRPASIGVIGAEHHVLPVKPIDRFLESWELLQRRVLGSSGLFDIACVGAGAGGVEVTLAIQHRLRQLLHEQGDDPHRLRMSLYTDDPVILMGHSAAVRRRFERILQQRNVHLHPGAGVVEVGVSSLRLADGRERHADATLWATHASSPVWPAGAGLAVDRQGFIVVDEFLRSTSHPQVFAAGDIASLPDQRPKSGVFAVRQGPVLHHNLVAAASGKPLKPYVAQKHFLGLISTGDRYAIASRGKWSAQGGWLWRVKDRIDRRFMRRFNELPDMPEQPLPAVASGLADSETLEQLAALPMRCGGCGAKVGASVLSRVMDRLPVGTRPDVLVGRDAPDDGTILRVPSDRLLVQSVDYFRAFIDDAYVFGAIAANHALGDLYAMGAEPQSALAVATVPFGREPIVEEQLFELLSGAQSVLEKAGAVLTGGHSSEGLELAFGLTVNGLVAPDQVLRKGGLQPGDVLILTKPLGTGTLFAADMRHKARGRWIQAAIDHMLQSNDQAPAVLRAHGVRACTDVTGFGLLGHLLEMLKASWVDAQLYLEALPVLDGALETLASGIVSSLQPANLRLRHAVYADDAALAQPAYPLLFDPQTAGGLLAGLPADSAQNCLSQLRRCGYEAQLVGAVSGVAGERPMVGVRSDVPG